MAAAGEKIGPGGFEAVVSLMLEALKNIFIESVEVEHGPRIDVEGEAVLELGFQLTYQLANQPRHWLIECECRERSKAAIERLLAAKPSRPQSRMIFLYHLDQDLTEDLRRTLGAVDVDHYTLKEFGIRLDEVNCALAADAGLDRALFRLELMKKSRHYPALRAAFSRMRVAT